MNLFEILHSFGSNVWIYGGTFILVLSILVFVHEWGHYIVARYHKVRVETFSIGFGREIFGWNDKHGTRWKFSMIPLGGYVKLYGDVDPASMQQSDNIEDSDSGQMRPMSEQERSVAFFSKSVAQRSAIVFAGPAINYIFAIILLMGLYVTHGKPVTPPVAAAVIGGSSAEQYGFEPHDKILRIDGRSMNSFEDIRTAMMIALDTERHFVVERDGEQLDIFARAEKVEQQDRFGFRHSRGLLGLISPRHAIQVNTISEIDGVAFELDAIDAKVEALKARMGQVFTIVLDRAGNKEVLTIKPLEENNTAFFEHGQAEEISESGEVLPFDAARVLLHISDGAPNEFVKFGVFTAMIEATKQTYVITTGTLNALGQMITGTRSATELGGIIRIGAVAGDMAQQGLVALILFTALLSINLGLINLFPIPMLDGGHLVFYACEALRGKPVSEQVQEYAFRFGLFFLVCIMVFANLNDILQLVL
ncbi:MAG: RIP metalloprotease RseP [Alphaproteobacteria bacterium]